MEKMNYGNIGNLNAPTRKILNSQWVTGEYTTKEVILRSLQYKHETRTI